MSDTQTNPSPTTVPQGQPATGDAASARPSRGPSALQIAIVVAILGGGILVTSLTSNVTAVAEPGIRLADGRPYLEQNVGDWSGGEMTGLSDDERKILPADTEGARRIYTNKDGDRMFCSIVLEGHDVTSIHRPELCLTGQGWTLEKPIIETINVARTPHGVLKLSRLNATRDVRLENGRTTKFATAFAYWFIAKDGVTESHFRRILWTMRDRVLLNRSKRWAYVLIYAIPSETNAAADRQSEADRLIRDFVQQLYPTLVPG